MLKTEKFKYKASIDWIEIEITTVKTSNFHSIRNLFKANYVKPIKPKLGGATNTFKFRIQDLQTWKSLEVLLSIANRIKPISSVKIVGIEISLDAFSNGNNKDELIEKVAEFYLLLENPSSKNHRAAGSYKGSAEAMGNHKSNIRKIIAGKSIYVGSQKTDSISHRFYYKTIDNKLNLPVESHSARYEVTFINDACPFNTIEEAKAYKLTNLSKLFKFRKIDDNQSEMMRIFTNATRQLGKINMKRIAGGGIKVQRIGTKADTPLNRIIYDKLRELNIRLQK